MEKTLTIKDVSANLYLWAAVNANNITIKQTKDWLRTNHPGFVDKAVGVFDRVCHLRLGK